MLPLSDTWQAPQPDLKPPDSTLSGLVAAALPSSTPSEALEGQGEEAETKSSSEDLSTRARNPRPVVTSLVKRKTPGIGDKPQLSKEMVVGLRDGVEQLLNMDMQRFSNKRGRDAGDGEGQAGVGRNRRARSDDFFNGATLIGSIFMRVQGTHAPAPLVYFDDDIHNPHWFKESIDGVQPVISHEAFDPEAVTLESMGKLVEGNVLPATLGEVAAYFGHVLGDPRTNKEITPRVLIAIQCDRAKGWFTYKRDHDNNNFVPVVLCAAESGRGLEEVSPAHFEVHRAQCAQKKWRQSFKVLGAQKLHKVTSLAQAALGDVLRHLERILSPSEKAVLRTVDANGQQVTVAAPRITAANHPTFRQQASMPTHVAVLESGVDLVGSRPSDLVPPRISAGMESALSPLGRLPAALGLDEEAVQRTGSTTMHMAAHPGVPRVHSAGLGVTATRAGLLGTRPVQAVAGSRLLGNRPVLRRGQTDVDAAAAHDVTRGLDLLATAASTHITSPRTGALAGSGVQAGLLAAALGGISFNELLQLVLDDQQRKQHHAQQAQLLQQLASLTAQGANMDKADIALSAAATASTIAAGPEPGAGKDAVGGDGEQQADPAAAAGSSDKDGVAGAGAVPSVVLAPPSLPAPVREAIGVIMHSVRGVDVSHAVRGILQHVAMQHTSDTLPTSTATGDALAAALTKAAAAEGLVQAGEGEAAATAADPVADSGMEIDALALALAPEATC